MILEIHLLRRKATCLRKEKETLRTSYSLLEYIVGSLKDDGRCAEIINRLKDGESYRDIAGWLKSSRKQGDDLARTSNITSGPD